MDIVAIVSPVCIGAELSLPPEFNGNDEPLLSGSDTVSGSKYLFRK